MDICKYCGKEFSARKLSHHKGHGRSYCNVSCYLNHVTKHTLKTPIEETNAPPKKRKYTPKIPNDYGNGECVICGVKFKKSTHSHLYCSKKCQKRNGNKQREIKHKGFKNNGIVDNSITLNLLIKRDKCKCAICGGKVNMVDFKHDECGYFITGGKYPTIDHILPRAKGGTHTWDNVQLAHQICNSYKTDNLVYCGQLGQMALSI